MNINKTISFVKSRIKYHADNMAIADNEMYYNSQLKKVEHYENCLVALFEYKQLIKTIDNGGNNNEC